MDQIKEPDLLRQVARLQSIEIERLLAKLVKARERIAQLEGRSPEETQAELKLLEQQLNRTLESGTSKGKSERRSRKKPEDEDAEPKPKPKPKETCGPTPQDLPIEEQVHDLDEPDKVCPCCGGELLHWEGQDETHDVISVSGIEYKIERHIRKKYRCGCGGAIETAEGPPKLSKGGRYSDEFLIHVATSKFDAHLPLNRQVRLAKSAGLEVTSQTLWKQLQILREPFLPALDRLHDYLLTKEALFADESRWPVLGSTKGPSKNWTAWVLVADDAVRHFIKGSRGLEDGADILRGYTGVLTTDGYVVYKSLAKSENFIHTHCWAHARRYLIEAENTEPEVAGELLDEIGQLFGIERKLAEETKHAPEGERRQTILDTRQACSKPIVARLGEKLGKVRALLKSPIAAAVRYFENQWEGLTRFLDYPEVQMTSNAAERGLRGLVLGRHNHQGSRSELGTQVSADFYSLIESAKLNHLDPKKYFRTAIQYHHEGRKVPLPHEIRRGIDPDEVEYPPRPPPPTPAQVSFPLPQ